LDLATVNTDKTRLVSILKVWTLFNFDHLDFLEHFEAVAAFDQKDDVAFNQNSAFKIPLVTIVKIDSKLALLEEQHLLGIVYLTRHRIMYMRRNNLAGWVTHVRQLLGVFTRCNEMNSRFTKLTRYDNCNDSRPAHNPFD